MQQKHTTNEQRHVAHSKRHIVAAAVVISYPLRVQTALQTKQRGIEELQQQHMTKEQRIGDLEHKLEGEARALAAARNDLHSVRLYTHDLLTVSSKLASWSTSWRARRGRWRAHGVTCTL